METVTSKDGTRIAYDKSGSGPAVIIVSGATSTRAAEIPLASLLASHFTVYAYDRRGRVDSGDTLPFAVEREFEDIAAIINVAGGSASLYGISSGAILAFRAVASGLPVTQLALWEPPFSVDESGRQHHLEYRKQLDKLIAEGRREEAARVTIPTLILDGGPSDPFFHAAAQSLLVVMPNAQLKSIDGQPHNVDP